MSLVFSIRMYNEIWFRTIRKKKIICNIDVKIFTSGYNNLAMASEFVVSTIVQV